MIKRSFAVAKQDDSNTVPIANISALGNNTISEVVYPYGYYAVAPEKSQALTFNVLGQENNQASILYENLSRFSGLKVGEVQVGSQISKNSIKFSSNGDININNDNASISITSSNMVLSFGSAQFTITETGINSNVPITSP